MQGLQHITYAHLTKKNHFFSDCYMHPQAVFSPEFTGRRAQIISHDHAHHLERSDCHYQTLVACVLLSTKHFSSV